jgi:hypothetical protein
VANSHIPDNNIVKPPDGLPSGISVAKYFPKIGPPRLTVSQQHAKGDVWSSNSSSFDIVTGQNEGGCPKGKHTELKTGEYEKRLDSNECLVQAGKLTELGLAWCKDVSAIALTVRQEDHETHELPMIDRETRLTM